ncbi:MAG: deoxyguanosinetriphosphate triphosphohydrolase [Spartobacteria bacterium]|nr:deoxyguanosinetriphosphate triphosphohydrolase [Spartobacteria bacterium]
MEFTQDMTSRFEDEHLAAYASRCSQTHGRKYDEPAHRYRTVFHRDRDRVVHSKAFRRLEYKTQVFVNGTADHYRTRLTHTIEVAAVAVGLARILGCNSDLAEVIALAHDLGHSPFGHCGERELDQLMKNEGGFDHNIQSLRSVETLESPYPYFEGLNLSWEVGAGLRKHLAAIPGAVYEGLPIGPFQSMEAQIADLADDISYHAADIEDGLEAGLLKEEQFKEVEFWRIAEQSVKKRYGTLPQKERIQMTIRAIFQLQVEDVASEALRRLEKHDPHSPDEVMQAPERMVCFSPAMKQIIDPYRAFLFQHVYWHAEVQQTNDAAVHMMRRLFLYFIENPDSMGSKARARLQRHGLWRTVCDYVAGMTDRYALEEVSKYGL